MPPGQPQQPDQPPAAHRERVPYRVGVHLPGQRQLPARLDHPGPVDRRRYPPQFPGQVVLGQLALVRYRFQGGPGGVPQITPAERVGQLGGGRGPADELGVQRGVRGGGPRVQPVQARGEPGHVRGDQHHDGHDRDDPPHDRRAYRPAGSGAASIAVA